MGRRRISIHVRPDGSIVAATQGTTGPKCLEELELIQQLCDGAVLTESKLTSDYHAMVTAERQGWQPVTETEGSR